MKNKGQFIVQQFDVVTVRLDPTMGREQKGTRPCVVLHTNAIGQKSGTFLVAPLTSQHLDRLYPHDVVVRPTKGNGLTVTSKTKLDQMRVVDESRIIKKLGAVEESLWPLLRSAIVILFDLGAEFV